MKDLKQRCKVLGSCTLLLLGLSSPAFGRVRSTAPQPILINETTLLDLLLKNGNSVLSGLNGVYQAKEQVNVARGNILPSLSLSAALSAVSGFGLCSSLQFEN